MITRPKKYAPKPPPREVWVSWCTKCGTAIIASIGSDPHATSCPDCEIELLGKNRFGPRVRYALYVPKKSRCA